MKDRLDREATPREMAEWVVYNSWCFDGRNIDPETEDKQGQLLDWVYHIRNKGFDKGYEMAKARSERIKE